MQEEILNQNSHDDGRYKRRYMKCIKCNIKIVRQLWLVDGDAYCSPKCERGVWVKDGKPQDAKFKYISRDKYNDKNVEKNGVAGLKKKQ